MDKQEQWLEYLVARLALKHSATLIDDVVYYDRLGFRQNKEYKHGEKYKGLSKPHKQIHNLGFWYLWKDIEILNYEQWEKVNT